MGLKIRGILTNKGEAENVLDVIIIGSGPAGISTALNLAREWPDFAERMLLIEKSRHPRLKICGGGLTPDSLLWLDQLGVSLPQDVLQLAKTRVVFDGKGVDTFPIHTVCREAFDESLYEKARQVGIPIAQDEKAISFKKADGHIVVHTEKRQLRCKVLVGADGTKSIVRQWLIKEHGIQVPKTICRTLRILVEDPTHASLEHQDRLALFDFELPAAFDVEGYAWSFPYYVNESAWLNLGITDFNLSQRKVKSLIPAFQEFLAKKGIVLNRTQLESAPIRWYRSDNLMAGDRVLFAGDAAGIDPLLADGISFSLGYGEAAAQEIIKAFKNGTFSFVEYSLAVQRHRIGQELQHRLDLAGQVYIERKWDQLGIFLSLPAEQTLSNNVARTTESTAAANSDIAVLIVRQLRRLGLPGELALSTAKKLGLNQWVVAILRQLGLTKK